MDPMETAEIAKSPTPREDGNDPGLGVFGVLPFEVLLEIAVLLLDEDCTPQQAPMNGLRRASKSFSHLLLYPALWRSISLRHFKLNKDGVGVDPGPGLVKVLQGVAEQAEVQGIQGVQHFQVEYEHSSVPGFGKPMYGEHTREDTSSMNEPLKLLGKLHGRYLKSLVLTGSANLNPICLKQLIAARLPKLELLRLDIGSLAVEDERDWQNFFMAVSRDCPALIELVLEIKGRVAPLAYICFVPPQNHVYKNVEKLRLKLEEHRGAKWDAAGAHLTRCFPRLKELSFITGRSGHSTTLPILEAFPDLESFTCDALDDTGFLIEVFERMGSKPPLGKKLRKFKVVEANFTATDDLPQEPLVSIDEFKGLMDSCWDGRAKMTSEDPEGWAVLEEMAIESSEEDETFRIESTGIGQHKFVYI